MTIVLTLPICHREPNISNTEKDGNSINLHHIGQDSRGPLIEVSTKQHSAKNAQAFKALHNQHNGKKHPDFPVSHDKDWISDIKNYWKWRANNGK